MAGHVTGLELHEACTLGDYDALEEYMKSGKYENYINMKDPEWQNRTPIHWACSKGKTRNILVLYPFMGCI